MNYFIFEEFHLIQFFSKISYYLASHWFVLEFFLPDGESLTLVL